MFLDSLRTKNPSLVAAAVHLHQTGELRANTYLLDVDGVAQNARTIRLAADEHGLTVYAMTKQFGRNPDACRAIVDSGITAAVAVDLQCQEAVMRAGMRVGHAGHLVQPNLGTEDAVIAARPDVVTVFNEEIAARIGAAASRAAVLQPVLLRVVAPGDRFYFGHGGGFPLDSVVQAAARIAAIAGLRIVGVTSFPCLAADEAARAIVPTPNFATIVEAAERLRRAGHEISQVNAPGTTSARTMKTLALNGATHVEPGNAFHGTTPLHLWESDAPEIPAIAYVSEVSHLEGDDAYVFGAGLYVDKVLGQYGLRALCGRDETILERLYAAEMAPDGAIHYYCKLHLPSGHDVRVGDTVVFCFRPQVFVTRGRTQGLVGLRSGAPRLSGVYDVEARSVEGVA
jgi:predicted amino acid racemase